MCNSLSMGKSAAGDIFYRCQRKAASRLKWSECLNMIKCSVLLSTKMLKMNRQWVGSCISEFWYWVSLVIWLPNGKVTTPRTDLRFPTLQMRRKVKISLISKINVCNKFTHFTLCMNCDKCFRYKDEWNIFMMLIF